MIINFVNLNFEFLQTVKKTKAYATFDDYLTFGFIFIENAQVISIGPDFAFFNGFISKVAQILSLNLIDVISFKDQTF